MRATSAWGLLLLAACGTTEPDAAGLLRGSFGTPIQNRSGYLGLSLHRSGQGLSGWAWSTFSPSLLGGATVTGSYDPPTVHHALHPRLTLTEWQFDGILVGDTLKGQFGFGGNVLESVELPRVDTIPLGEYSMSITGSVHDTAIGSAWFTYSGTTFQLTQSFQIQSVAVGIMTVAWKRRDLPGPGTYALSAEGGPGPSVIFLYGPPEDQPLRYSLQSGTITISVSSRYALAGSYTLSATSPAGAPITAKGKFSSGCWSTSC